MKKIIICLILSFTAGVVFGQAKEPTFVVSTFSARGQAVSADDAESITELFIAELAKVGGLRVVDRTSLDRVVSEMRFQTSDWSNPQKTAQLGTALNAEFLVRGQINQLGQKISVAITALDIKTLEVVSSSTKTFSAENLANNFIYSNGYSGIFYEMRYITSDIASPVRARKELIEQESHSLVGTWKATGNGLQFRNNMYENFIEIIFFNNGTLSITWKETFYIMYSYDSHTIIRDGKGTGHYSRNGSNLNINCNVNYIDKMVRWYISNGVEYEENKRTDSESVSKNIDITIKFSQDGRTMTWSELPFGKQRFGWSVDSNIQKIFVKQ